MKVEGWLEIFRKHPQLNVMSLRHLELLTGQKPHALRVGLSRLVRRGVIRRICRGHYANPFHPPTLEQIASQIHSPSYVSLESALSRHGVLSQMPQELTCVTTRASRTLRTSYGLIRYRKIKKEFFFGFSIQGGAALAEPEKALADLLYFRRRGAPSRPLPDLNREGIRAGKLRSYARRMEIPLPP